MKTLKRDVTEYIYEHYSPLASWSPKKLMRWVQWAIAQGRLVVVREANETIAGLTVFRTLRPGTNTQVYGLESDPAGEVVYIDLAISTKGKSVLKVLLHSLLERLGPRPLIAFNQAKYQDRLRVYSMSQFKGAIYGRRK